jgi:hypothetical protein
MIKLKNLIWRSCIYTKMAKSSLWEKKMVAWYWTIFLVKRVSIYKTPTVAISLSRLSFSGSVNLLKYRVMPRIRIQNVINT